MKWARSWTTYRPAKIHIVVEKDGVRKAFCKSDLSIAPQNIPDNVLRQEPPRDFCELCLKKAGVMVSQIPELGCYEAREVRLSFDELADVFQEWLELKGAVVSTGSVSTTPKKDSPRGLIVRWIEKMNI